MRHLCPSKRVQDEEEEEEEDEVKDTVLLVILKMRLCSWQIMPLTVNEYMEGHIVSHMLEGGGWVHYVK